MKPCEHFTTGPGYCGESPTRQYMNGWRCAAHTPARLAGRPETRPDPARTLEGLRQAAKVEAKRLRILDECTWPGWERRIPRVSALGWVAQPGRSFRGFQVDHAAIHAVERRIGDELTRRAQIARVERREAS